MGKRTATVRREEVSVVQWDLGVQGWAVLAVMSLAFAAAAQLVAGKVTTRRLWMIAGAAYFVAGLLISEVWFGWATQTELQPNIDGLSFDEVLLFGLMAGIGTVFVTWFVTRRHRRIPRIDTGSRATGRTRVGADL